MTRNPHQHSNPHSYFLHEVVDFHTNHVALCTHKTRHAHARVHTHTQHTLLVLLAGDRRLSEALEPRVVVLVEAPGLPLELVGGHVLLVGLGLEVEGKEQALRVNLQGRRARYRV